MHFNVYAVRHNGTGAYLSTEWAKGGSWWEGEALTEKSIPRLFYSFRAAQAFVSQWARGRVTKSRMFGSTPWDDDVEVLEHEDVGRKASDLRIVAMKLEEC